MRLLLTADTAGGVWTFACELAGELVRRGHTVLLVSLGGTPSGAHLANVAALAKRETFTFRDSEVPLEWQPGNASAYTAGADLLLRLCSEFRPDALLLSQFCYGALPVAVPKVVIAHSDVLSWADAVGRAPLAEDAWLRTYRSLVQVGLDGADWVVAPTLAMLTGLKLHFKVAPGTAVVPNGCTLPVSASGIERGLCAVTAGRMWDPAKNQAMLLKAELPLPVLVAGASDALPDAASGISLLGQLSSDALHALLYESAIYLCCSIYEPFGLAPLEAALCGCALVVNDIPSLREVWGDAALYFCNAETMNAALRSLVDDSRALAAAQARSFARAQHYTAAAMGEGYLQVLSTLTAAASEGELAA